MKKNLVYTLILAGAVTMTACSKDELSNNILDASGSEIRFTGAIKKQSEVLLTTRAEEPNPDNYETLNETKENFGTFFIWLDVDGTNNSYFQAYEEAPGETGNLKVKESDNNEGRLNWVDKTSGHTFYAWTEPHVPEEGGTVTGGVQMEHKEITPSETTITDGTTINDITGTVIYGTNEKTDLEKFIVTKKGPLTYNDWGQDVALYFERPIAKIELVGITHIKSDGSQDIIGTNDNFQCTINFPNMYKEATFTPAYFDYDNLSQLLSTEGKGKGLVWNYSYNTRTSGSVLYVHPFTFGDENTDMDIYNDPGYFIVSAKFNENEEEKNYAATLADLSKYTKLKAGEHMKLWLYLRDGGGVGIGYEIVDWSKDPDKELPQYRIPGVYNEEDAKRLLEALQKAADISTYPSYKFPTGVEDLVVETSGDSATSKTYEINLFTHIDWSSIEDGITTINIPDNCTLKGNGYNITLKKGDSSITITGKIKNLYVNGEKRPDTSEDNSGSEGTTQP